MTIESWEDSTLPRAIVDRLRTPRTLAQLADDLQITDARVLWYLQRLESAGRVTCEDERWQRTPLGDELLATAPAQVPEASLVPGRTVYDFVQAHADAAAGMFGDTYVQLGDEHGGRLSLEQAEEFQHRLRALIDEYFAPGMADRSGIKYGLRWVLTPTDLHPLDDN